MTSEVDFYGVGIQRKKKRKKRKRNKRKKRKKINI